MDLFNVHNMPTHNLCENEELQVYESVPIVPIPPSLPTWAGKNKGTAMQLSQQQFVVSCKCNNYLQISKCNIRQCQLTLLLGYYLIYRKSMRSQVKVEYMLQVTFAMPMPIYVMPTCSYDVLIT